MDLKINYEDNYDLVKISKVNDTSELTAGPIEDVIDELNLTSNPVILTFDNKLKADEAFFNWIRKVRTCFHSFGISWILIPPFNDAFEQLDDEGIEFAPTFEEAVDMAIMIKIENDLSGDDTDDEPLF